MTPQTQMRGYILPALSMLSALGVFAILQVLAMRLTGGVFEYPLDDPYIHLAIADTMAHGGYGVNMQDLSSPGSSALFPVLLMPFAGTDLQRFLPLFWNIVGMSLTAYFWGRLLWEAGYGGKAWRWLGIAAAVLGPLALMMPMVAYVGMEHTLHAAAAMAVLLGLHRHIAGKGGTWLILAGAFFGSAFRLEGMALAVVAGGALFFTGKRGFGAAVIVAGILPIVLFSGFLTFLGLDPLPSSVQTKLADGGADGPNLIQSRLLVFLNNLRADPGKLVLALSLASLAIWRITPNIRDTRWSAFAIVVVFAGLAHMALGQIGWLNRYEHYVLVLTASGFLALLPHAVKGRTPIVQAGLGVALVVVGGFAAYRNPVAFFYLPPAARAIHNQQGQMATFAKDYLKTDVAVNDLGWVAWRNPNYVLDLWGLASAEARDIRQSDPAPGWAGTLTDKYNVPAAMIYDRWFEDGIGTDWVRIGRFGLTESGGFLGDYTVAFYATSPEAVPMMQTAITAWLPTLRAGSSWIWDEGMEP